MEYCDGINLRDFIKKYSNKNELIEEEILYNIIKQICIGIKGIHENNIIHRDLKPENIFMNSKNEIKIGEVCTSNYQLEVLLKFKLNNSFDGFDE